MREVKVELNHGADLQHLHCICWSTPARTAAVCSTITVLQESSRILDGLGKFEIRIAVL